MPKSAHLSLPFPAFASGTSTLSIKRGRCALPKDVVAAWELGGSLGDEKLVAELQGEGHIRLHRRQAVQARIDASLKEAEEEEGITARQRALRAHYDRFRYVGFSAADNNRLLLPQPSVLALIGSTDVGAKVKLYVELAFDAVDLLTNLARLRRQPDEDET